MQCAVSQRERADKKYASIQRLTNHTHIIEHRYSRCCLWTFSICNHGNYLLSIKISCSQNFSVKIMRITLIICLVVCLQLAQQAFAFVPLSTCRRTTTTSISMGGGRSQAEKALTNRQVTRPIDSCLRSSTS